MPSPAKKQAAKKRPAKKQTGKKKPAAKKRGGRRPGSGQPPFEPSETDRETVRTMVATGIPHADIAACLGDHGIDPATMRKHFAREIETAVTQINGLCGAGIIRAMHRGEPWALRYWSSARMGWNDRSRAPDETAAPGQVLWDEFVRIYRGKDAMPETAETTHGDPLATRG
jgi:hypothetical protein